MKFNWRKVLIQYVAIVIFVMLHSLAVAYILSGPSEHKQLWIEFVTAAVLGPAIAFGECFPAKKD